MKGRMFSFKNGARFFFIFIPALRSRPCHAHVGRIYNSGGQQAGQKYRDPVEHDGSRQKPFHKKDWLKKWPAESPSTTPAPTVSPTLRPTVSKEVQDQLVTCVSVIDETNIASFAALWNNLRNEYPDRPFCLLQPVPTPEENVELQIPDAFFDDPSLNTWEYIPREDAFAGDPLPPGVVPDANNWYNLCNLEARKQLGITKVGTFPNGRTASRRFPFGMHIFLIT